MSVKSIRESTGKDLLNRFLPQATGFVPSPFVLVDEKTNLCELTNEHAWLLTDPLQVKPDQLIKDQDTLGLVKQNTDFAGVCQFIKDHILKTVNVCSSVGKLRNFLIEPFIKHEGKEVNLNLSINSHRNGDTIRLEALNLEVSIEESLDIDNVKRALLTNTPMKSQDCVAKFIVDLYRVFVELYFTNLEISLLLLANKDSIHISKLSAKLDGTAEYLCKSKWGQIDFPPPFGRDALPEEAAIVDLDSRSGASLKFTVLNRNGRIWTMVAGGGASVIYADTICQLGGAAELANYGEYSGAPSEQQTYEYARTILSLMCTNSERHSDGKILLIGGCIANFTNVAATFKGIVKALIEYRNQLIEHQVTIYCRRAGPNYQEGLQLMRDTGASLGIPVHVFGPETHMTAIVTMALKPQDVAKLPEPKLTTANLVLPRLSQSSPPASSSETPILSSEKHSLFTNQTKAIVWGMQNRAVQSTIDFDFSCSRAEWSVVAMVYPFSGDHKQKFYWGSKEILIPVYKNMSDAMLNHPDADVMISFASLRSAYESTLETLKYPQIRTIAIIAEGIPQNLTRKLIVQARQKGVTIIGPATVGGIKAGCFKIGNSGGMMDNLLSSRLYRPGSVGYVSRSGGMSNELNNIIARSTNGVCEGIAIGGDRFPGSTFLEHFLRYERDPQIKMLVLLGEVGGVEEYEVCEAIKDGRITKPLVAWCIGTCASLFSSDFQFGHAGACANSKRETATAKNESLRQHGALVPDSFDDLGSTINKLYQQLVDQNVIIPKAEVVPPTVPIDYAWARELGLIRKPTSFMTSICDERGNELTYAGIPISRVIKEDLGIGGTLSLLWFQRRLPTYATKFFEMVLMITADHGPAVSGAHNTIVCSRAGKDLISSLVSGLLTIGDRFGGALDASARQFSQAYDSNTSPHEFVNQMRQKGQLIMGIGHRVKSLNNPDMRVQLMKDYVKQTFPDTPILDYALLVEKVTTAKKSNLILNVDGVVAVSVVDLLRNCGCFTSEEAQEYLYIGVLNGLFVLGRSIGFIGHYFDQKRLKQQLYRHPWDDISYILPEPDK